MEANFGIQFFGRTKDVEALKYYPQMFGKEEKERKSRSTGKSGSSSNRSVTISSQKEDIYQAGILRISSRESSSDPPPVPMSDTSR